MDENITNNTIMDAITNLTASLKENTQVISKLSTNVEEIKQQFNQFNKDFLSFKTNTQTEIKALTSVQRDLTESQQFMSDQFETFKAELSQGKERAESAEKESVSLTAELIEMKARLMSESKARNNLEQYGRRSMIELNNIPVIKEENLLEIVEAVAKAMKHDSFSINDIDIVHRLNSKLAHPPIIVMFKNRTARNEFYLQRKNLKNIKVSQLGIKGLNEANFLFVNESLTIQNAILFKKVRSKCKLLRYEFSWTNNGNVLCRKNSTSKIIAISDDSDIDAKII